tara:strand:- start:6643 stop:6936 length:294 start_codon:yes stop_codon:yes gene_type:complete
MFASKLVLKLKKMKTISTIRIKENTLKLNQLALKTTENIVLKTIDRAENLQEITSKNLKSTFDFTAKQQDRLFNNLEKGKGMIWTNLNKNFGFFSRN